MRVTIHGPDAKGRYEVHAASCNAEVLSRYPLRYPLTVEAQDRTAVVLEMFGEEIREDGDYRSRREHFDFAGCLADLIGD